MFTSRTLWTDPILLVVAALLAHQVAFLHHIRSPGGWIAFAILAVALLGLDSFARWNGIGRWKRIGLNVGVIFLILFVNSATTLSRCDKNHNCHRVFGI